jgi:hypothetical protein
MKRIIMLAIVSVMLLVSIEGCMWVPYRTGRGGTAGGHDSDQRHDNGKRHDNGQKQEQGR